MLFIRSWERFCLLFSESSPGRWAVLQRPCCPSKQGELSENILQNLSHDLMNNPVVERSDENFVSCLECFDLFLSKNMKSWSGALSEDKVQRCCDFGPGSGVRFSAFWWFRIWIQIRAVISPMLDPNPGSQLRCFMTLFNSNSNSRKKSEF